MSLCRCIAGSGHRFYLRFFDSEVTGTDHTVQENADAVYERECKVDNGCINCTATVMFQMHARFSDPAAGVDCSDSRYSTSRRMRKVLPTASIMITNRRCTNSATAHRANGQAQRHKLGHDKHKGQDGAVPGTCVFKDFSSEEPSTWNNRLIHSRVLSCQQQGTVVEHRHQSHIDIRYSPRFGTRSRGTSSAHRPPVIGWRQQRVAPGWGAARDEAVC